MNKYLRKAIEHYESNIAIFQKNKQAYTDYATELINAGVGEAAKFVMIRLRKDGISWFSADCPLCERYAHYKHITACWMCPVWKDDHSGCHGTPWEDLSYILNVKNQTPSVWMNLIEKAFIKELEYLKGLSTKKFWR